MVGRHAPEKTPTILAAGGVPATNSRACRYAHFSLRRGATLETKLEQARTLAMEPTDPLTRERLAQLTEELEFQLQDQRKVA
jgi:hypothetical protein